MLKRLWNHDEGVLTFEWITLLTLLVIGVIGGIAAIRDAVIHEATGAVGAMTSLDQSYLLEPPLGVGVQSAHNNSGTCTSSAGGCPQSFDGSPAFYDGYVAPEYNAGRTTVPNDIAFGGNNPGTLCPQ